MDMSLQQHNISIYDTNYNDNHNYDTKVFVPSRDEKKRTKHFLIDVGFDFHFLKNISCLI